MEVCAFCCHTPKPRPRSGLARLDAHTERHSLEGLLRDSANAQWPGVDPADEERLPAPARGTGVFFFPFVRPYSPKLIA
jgi:hypothetical protein